ncbi:MAG: hypothetical protein ACI4QA_03030 [Candidatus Spyradosoma sp.]
MIKKILFLIAAGALCAYAAAENPHPRRRGNDAPPPPPPETCADAECGEGEPPPPPHARNVSPQEMQMLKTLFSMSDKELARIRELITRLERTPENRRREMARDLESATSDDPEVREKFMTEMRRRYDERRRNLLARYYATLPEDQAKAEAEAFLKMSRREQFDYLRGVREKLGMPKPEPGRRRGPDKKDRDAPAREE